MKETILVIDFGSQVTQLIARRVRENGVYCEVHPFNRAQEALAALKPRAIILSGGPSSVTAIEGPRVSKEILEKGIPVLGICYGQQLLCSELGGQVSSGQRREFGRANLKVLAKCSLFDDVWSIGGTYPVWMSHGDHVDVLPDGFSAVGSSENAPFAAIADEERKFYGLQFHPEVIHTPQGKTILRNFTHKIAKCSGDWTMSAFKESAIASIRQQVGEKRVICGLSGGVDSSVAAVLINKAIGDQLHCIFVDHGLMRKNEAEEVVEIFNENFSIPLVHRDASDLFMEKLVGVTDPEQTRKIIGNTFIDVFEEEACRIGDVDFLAQGTLYPDVIESVSAAGGPSVTIKSHHNVGGLPERMQLDLVEPLRDLFKDEVRELGRELGLPEEMVGRHPFPGPGLAIRIPGEVSRDKADILRDVDEIFIDEIRKSGLYDEIWQAFAVLLPVRTVGVMGDARSYEYACSLRAVTSVDGMTADYYPFDHQFLSRVATRIINEVRGVNRVNYDVTSKPPGTIEWE